MSSQLDKLIWIHQMTCFIWLERSLKGFADSWSLPFCNLQLNSSWTALSVNFSSMSFSYGFEFWFLILYLDLLNLWLAISIISTLISASYHQPPIPLPLALLWDTHAVFLTKFLCQRRGHDSPSDTGRSREVGLALNSSWRGNHLRNRIKGFWNKVWLDDEKSVLLRSNRIQILYFW